MSWFWWLSSQTIKSLGHPIREDFRNSTIKLLGDASGFVDLPNLRKNWKNINFGDNMQNSGEAKKRPKQILVFWRSWKKWIYWFSLQHYRVLCEGGDRSVNPYLVKVVSSYCPWLDEGIIYIYECINASIMIHIDSHLSSRVICWTPYGGRTTMNMVV